MSNKIKIDRFDPISIKVIGKKKVVIKYFDLDLPNRIQTNDDSNIPHQDLLNCMKDFGEEMARALGILDGWDFARDNIKGNLDASKIARDSYENAVINCDVNQIAFFGQSKESIEISGTVTTTAGQKKQTTPRLSLDPEKNEFAKDMNFKVEELKKEIWAYLFGNKFVKTEKKKKEEAEQKAVESFEKAIDNNGEFPEK